MKHSLARTAVALASATLALGLSATSATASGTSGHMVDSASGGHFSSPVHVGKDRDIARLQKALRAAKHERAAARAEASDRRAADSVAEIDANAARAAVLVAIEKQYVAKADLATARTHLNEVRNLIANGSLLVEENRAAHNTAAAAVTKAEDSLASAEAKVTDLKNTLDIKVSERDAADRDAQAAAAQVDQINADIVTAQTALDTAQARYAAAAAQNSQDQQTLIQRVQSYSGGCWVSGPNNDEVSCQDNSGVVAERAEVTAAYRAYLASEAERDAASVARSDADMAVQTAAVDLAFWQDEHARLAAARDAAQAVVDTAQSALDEAKAAVVDATADLAGVQEDLATVVAEGQDLADRLASAQTDEKAAVKDEATKAVSLTDADAALGLAKATDETATGTAAATERDRQAAQADLDDARKQVASIKDRLKKIRQSR